MRRLIALAIPSAFALSFPLAGCVNESDIDPMMRQEKYKAYWSSEFYSDGRAMRIPPANTIPRERPLDALTSPPVTKALVERGRNRYDIHCAICHGLTGESDSVVASKMSLRPPPKFASTPKLLAYSAAQIFDVATNGYGYMPRYDSEITAADRWAISHYIKALQLSQHATLDEVPMQRRADLDKPAEAPSEKSEKKE
jgi:mono/diheme cytochrome c family protein